ncbi:formimidoylglutamase [Chondrinema litorale]|uniref:formimidoylglutamase n=1 Tax=Chondrinema litorale TaxID=2994555 RepID=UPI002543E4E8|nr:formimidoylglutamase [Chondrinema litorale]UZR97687.1 formimidoylglutamase [Chondrinema litorale]
MEKGKPNNLTTNYNAANPSIWTGRTTTSNDAQYWYQTIRFIDLLDTTSMSDKPDIVFIGYECEEGVRRNQGRIGAKKGSDVIRQKLARLPIHFEQLKIADAGNIFCIDTDLETCQSIFSNQIEKLIKNKSFPIALGGGHDIAYAHFRGICNALHKPNKKFGIINLDAHFDLRKVEVLPNSGTPFQQILNEFGKQTKYLAIGIQQHANTKELFETAKKTDSSFILSEDCLLENFTNISAQIDQFLSDIDYLYLTIDLDGFASPYAPGVSAPSPFGFNPNFVVKLLKHIITKNKLVALDIAEYNPIYDIDQITATLAARLIANVVGELDKR